MGPTDWDCWACVKMVPRALKAHRRQTSCGPMENWYQNPTLERSGGQEEKPTLHPYSPTLERSGGKEPPLHHYKRADILANRGKIN